MDGYELLGTLRAMPTYQANPVVMVTSRSAEKHRQKAIDLGATDYVIKPYQDETLLDMVSKLISQHRTAGA